MTTLSDLKIGDRAKIVSLNSCVPSYRHKLLAMGLTNGTEFTLVRIAPLGDPVIVKVRGFTLSLRKNEAIGLKLQKLIP